MRRLQFKFPSQIRISGWDFGSSARAMNQAGGKDSLMTYESVSLTQAEGSKYAPLTFERKTMSTKTTIKRIALVAVAALGLGMVSTVAANAASSNAADSVITGISVTALTTPARVGVPQTTTFKIKNTAGATAGSAGDQFNFSAIVTQVPTGSLVKTYSGVAFTNAGIAVNDSTPVAATGTPTAGNDTAATTAKYLITPAATKNLLANATSTAAGSLTFTPDVAGTYKITVFSDSASSGSLVSGAKYATWTVVAAGAPATATVSAVNPTAAACSATYSNSTDCLGSLIKVTLKDANGYPTAPRGAEVVTVTSSSTTTTPSSSAPVTLSASNVDVNGIYWANWTNTAAETVVVSTAGSGSLTGVSGLTTAASITYKAQTVLATGMSISDTTGTDVRAISGTGHYNSLGSATAVSVATSKTSVTFKVTAAAAGVTSLTIVDSSADITADAALAAHSWTVPVTITSDGAASPTYYGTYTVSASMIAGDSYSVVNTLAAAAVGNAATLTSATPAVSAANSTVSPSSSLAVVGGTIPVTVVVKDAFGYGVPNASVNFTTSATSRNPSISTYATTDANGSASYNLVDASTSTTNLQDVVTVIASYAGVATTITATATLNYKTSIAAGSVTVTTPDTTAGVANDTVSAQPINAGISGAQGTLVGVSAVIKDANGVVMVGAPVTWTISGPGTAVLSTKTTSYTDATGTATSSVYGWATGTYTVTATAGGKSGTGTVTFYSAAGNERKISATVDGSNVVAKAEDRYGNPVSGVTIYATITGGGNIGGLLSTSATTNKLGTATFVVTGAGTVTVTNINPANPAGSIQGQTSAAAGYDIGGSGATALTAYVAGTALKAETGVGASFSAAGVSSASVDVTNVTSSDAVDAANEATDAANAATDAANAAAEAADAATAAAQDAQAAVAALATQVASLIAGIKAQITTLTNLVVKIQKKVRA